MLQNQKQIRNIPVEPVDRAAVTVIYTMVFNLKTFSVSLIVHPNNQGVEKAKKVRGKNKALL